MATQNPEVKKRKQQESGYAAASSGSVRRSCPENRICNGVLLVTACDRRNVFSFSDTFVGSTMQFIAESVVFLEQKKITRRPSDPSTQTEASQSPLFFCCVPRPN